MKTIYIVQGSTDSYEWVVEAYTDKEAALARAAAENAKYVALMPDIKRLKARIREAWNDEGRAFHEKVPKILAVPAEFSVFWDGPLNYFVTECNIV